MALETTDDLLEMNRGCTAGSHNGSEDDDRGDFNLNHGEFERV